MIKLVALVVFVSYVSLVSAQNYTCSLDGGFAIHCVSAGSALSQLYASSLDKGANMASTGHITYNFQNSPLSYLETYDWSVYDDSFSGAYLFHAYVFNKASSENQLYALTLQYTSGSGTSITANSCRKVGAAGTCVTTGVTTTFPASSFTGSNGAFTCTILNDASVTH
eukprot:TRINITY_DN6650_c0_g1_i1.p1 TRINITY_DN6650_c0_g1~~TRINITY_DN6650_c0_g1_i1.p1  ORF type:complete len:179 (+),score=45.82 TRINITY_DN6650_c0_g1_i1:36-539(+)